MGMFTFGSSGSVSGECLQPNPKNFTIKNTFEHGKYAVLWVNYPDCENFEGDKIILGKKNLLKATTLDPHFYEDGDIFARFQPTEKGWKEARFLACSMTIEEKLRKNERQITSN